MQNIEENGKDNHSASCFPSWVSPERKLKESEAR